MPIGSGAWHISGAIAQPNTQANLLQEPAQNKPIHQGNSQSPSFRRNDTLMKNDAMAISKQKKPGDANQ